MFRKALLTASMSAVLGMAAMMPTTALAQFGPPPGPPPGLGGPPPSLGGPPPGLGGPPPGIGGPPPGLGGPSGGLPHAGLVGPPRPGGDAPRFSGGRGFEGRSAALRAGRQPMATLAPVTRGMATGMAEGGTGLTRFMPMAVPMPRATMAATTLPPPEKVLPVAASSCIVPATSVTY